MKAADTITVALDGQPHLLPVGTTLAALVAQLDHAPAGVTTALNGVFVPRGERNQHVLADADAVLLFQPIVGG
jgi:sulfur carrier protein